MEPRISPNQDNQKCVSQEGKSVDKNDHEVEDNIMLKFRKEPHKDEISY